MKIKILTFILFIFIFTGKTLAIDTKADQAIVMDFDTNEILFEKKSNHTFLKKSVYPIYLQ